MDNRKRLALLLCAALCFPGLALARGGGHSGHHSTPSSSGSHVSHQATANVTRDSHGRIKRSASAKHAFEKSHPCPATSKSSGGCPGYVVDHVVPLKHGGADAPSNMQWQTREAAKAKDKTE
jgi:hypothetical protein